MRLVLRLISRPATHDQPTAARDGRTQRLRRPDGTELQIEHYGRADGPALIFTHGWGTDSTEGYYLKRQLSDAIGISQKHVITQFKRMVGVSPKELAGLLRLKHVFSMINPAQPVDWGLLAQQAGYYDQAHFNKDFKAFLGHSPTDYLRLRRQFYAKFPEQDLYLRTLPIG